MDEIYRCVDPKSAWDEMSRLINASRRKLVHPPASSFKCKYCHAFVNTLSYLSGVQNRNHCPFCLRSRHLDWLKPGDRLSACKGIMQPIGLSIKPGRNKYGSGYSGELLLVHCCSACKKLTINRIAADDTVEGLVIVLHESDALDIHTRNSLKSEGIRLLQARDEAVVTMQLVGRCEN